MQEPNQRDWGKGRRLVRYFACTRDFHLILRYDGLKFYKWSVDAAFAMRHDFKSHSRDLMMMSPLGGGMASGSAKQKLNNRSSTEAEMVSSDDFLTIIILCKTFLREQGIRLNQNILLQNNLSAKTLIEKGGVSRKRSRAMNIHYFAMKVYCKQGELKIGHCPTNAMVGYYMTKPLQGIKFKTLEN